MPKHPRVFMEFTIGAKPAGRVVFELYNDITPITAENFRGLCTGEYSNSNTKNKSSAGQTQQRSKLHYLGSKIHRIVDGFVIQGGDITKGDGTGGDCIYQEREFKDENFSRRHAHAGILSMANAGPNTNSSQFFITLQECQHLDGKHVVFGQVIEGMDVIRQIAKVPTEMNDKPRIPVHVFDCGEVKEDAQSSDDDSEREVKNAYSMYMMHQKRRRLDQEAKVADRQEAQPPEKEEKEINSKELIEKIRDPGRAEREDPVARKRAEIQRMMNQAIKANNEAVIQEQQRLNDPQYERRKVKEEYFREQHLNEKDLESKGIDKSKKYLFETATQAEKYGSKKKKKAGKETYGWNVFNTDSLYRAYEKRVNKIPKGDLTKGQREDLMAKEVEERIEKRNQFSRRRPHNEDRDVTSINERNKKFNEKLERNYSKYAAEIKSNLERGTALQ